MNIDDRVKYYLGNLLLYYHFKKPVKIDADVTNIINFNKIDCIDKDLLYSNKYQKQIETYVNDLRQHMDLLNLNSFKILIAFGDISFKLDKFALSKSRPVDSKNNFNVLLNLNIKRHWEKLSDVDNFDIQFEKKINKLIWRGSNTGNYINGKQRDLLVETFQNHKNKNIDIKYSELCQGNKATTNFILDKLSIEDQLKNKFILSVEGNDVATNLKWIMYSNSLVLMPKPTICSWFMEDKLIDGIHYVEIKSDFSNLEEKFNWCCNNLDKCLIMIQNAKKYVRQFLNEENEKKIIKKILEIYIATVKIN
jgi:hypothetical protein